MSKIVGVVGLINSGKNTVAEILVKNHKFIQDSFASSLKDACAVIFDWPREMLEGNTDESRVWREIPDEWWAKNLGIENFSPRLALQVVGTDVIRNNFSDKIWFLTLKNRIRKNTDKNFVISDVRFPNELDFIRENGGYILRVTRGKNPEWYDTALKANTGDDIAKNKMKTQYRHVHASESSLAGIECDYVIENNGTFTDLENKVGEIIKKIF